MSVVKKNHTFWKYLPEYPQFGAPILQATYFSTRKCSFIVAPGDFQLLSLPKVLSTHSNGGLTKRNRKQNALKQSTPGWKKIISYFLPQFCHILKKHWGLHHLSRTRCLSSYILLGIWQSIMPKKKLVSREVRSIICKTAKMLWNTRSRAPMWMPGLDVLDATCCLTTSPLTHNYYIQACLLGSPLTPTSDAMMQSIRFKLFGCNVKGGVTWFLCTKDAVVKLVVLQPMWERPKRKRKRKKRRALRAIMPRKMGNSIHH